MARTFAPHGRTRTGGTGMTNAGGGIVWRVAGLLLLCAACVAFAPAVAATTLAGRAPTATDDTGYSTSSGSPVVPLTVAAPGLLANDLDPDTALAGLSAIKVTDPTNGTVTVNANGGFVYTPTANFAGTDTFTYKVNDGTADSNTATVTITVVAPPVVTSTTPTNGAVDVLASATITVNFSVAVNVTASTFTLECPAGTPKTFTLAPAAPGGVSSYTLTPTSALPSGTVCTVTVVATQATNAATGTPMSSNYSFAFTVDTPPQVATTTPANNATNVLTNSTITVNFDKAVNATTASFTLECPSPTSKAFALSPAGPVTSYVLTPSANLPAGTVCTVTVVAANVTDVAGTAMAANVVFSFTTDAPPTVTTTTPANNATNVLTAATITVKFDRAVNVTASAFTLECPVGTPETFAVSPASPASSYVLTPSVRLPASTVCTVSVVASQVTSAATGTAMATNYTFTFTVDTPPTVTTTTPANNVINVAANSTITVNFSKSVNASVSSFTLECPTPTGRAFTVSPAGPATAYVLTPTGGLPSDTLCTVTVVAANVTDVPGEPMAANYGLSFATPPLAVNDTYPETVVGNIAVNSANVAGGPYSVTANDTINLAVTITAFDATSAHGGTVSMTTSGATVGRFVYTPATNYTGGDTFTYTISNAHGTATATVSLTVSNRVLVASATGSGSACTVAAPCTLAAANGLAAPASGKDLVYAESGTYSGVGFGMNAGQSLIGQGIGLSGAIARAGITLPASAVTTGFSIAGAKPTLGGTVTLANNGQVHALDISAGTNTGLSGSGVTGVTVGQSGGTGTDTVAVTTSTGTAVSLTNSDGAFRFVSVNANGGTNGMLWNNTTQATGSLTVAGTGTAGSGGTIQNATADGISFNHASNVSLSWMSITNNSNAGIYGDNLSSFTIANSTVTNNDAANTVVAEAGLRFDNLLGTCAITNTTVSGTKGDNIRMTPTSGTLTNLAISGSTIGPNPSGTGANGIAVVSATSTLTITVTNTTFTGNQSSGFLTTIGTGATATINISGSTFQDNNINVDLGSSSTGTQTINILNNTLLRAASNSVNIVGDGQINGTISGNLIGNGTADSGSHNAYGIAVSHRSDSAWKLAITNNTIRNTDFEGIFVRSGDITGNTGSLDLTLTGNTVFPPDDNSGFPANPRGIYIRSRQGTTFCAYIANNESQGQNGGLGYHLQRSDTSVLRLQGFTSGGAATITANNNKTNGGVPTTDTIGEPYTGGTCQQPTAIDTLDLNQRAPSGDPGHGTPSTVASLEAVRREDAA